MLKSLVKPNHLYLINRYWEIIYVLAEREIKVRYRGSVLGVYWSLMNPLIMTGLYTSIFGVAFSKYYGNSIVNYILSAFTGLAIVHFFQGSTSQALVSVVNNSSLLNKISLPVSVFPLSIILANVFQLTVGMFPLLAVITLVTTHNLLLIFVLPFPLIALILVVVGMSLLVSALFVFFRDLPFFYELIQFILWLSSPVFYPAEIVPEKIRTLLQINPLYPIIQSLRSIILPTTIQEPMILWIAKAIFTGIVMVAIGVICFQWLRPKFMDLL